MTDNIDKHLNELVNGLLMLPEKDEDYTYGDAIRLTRFALLINPDAAFLRFNLACFYSAIGNIDNSLLHLEGALQQGYSDWKKIARDPSLESARRTARFGEIINKYFRQDKRSDKP